LVTDSHSFLARWMNHFLLLLNVHGVNEVRQTEIHTAEPLMPELSALSLRWLWKAKETQVTRYCSNPSRTD